MKQGFLALVLVLGAAANAADPAPVTVPIKAAPAKPAPVNPSPKKPLDLRIGDIRKYMTHSEYQAALRVPEADKNVIVVEGQRELVPMKRIEDVPPGLASLWYAAKHPLSSWRLLAPMVNAPEFKPPLDKIPPPVFRWGP